MRGIFLIGSLFISLLGFGQPKPKMFEPFITFLAKSGYIPSSMSKNCKWRYALVKVKCDKSNKIISHEFLNPVSSDIKEFFSFIDGYKFNRHIPIFNHPIVFSMTFENHNTDCILSNKAMATDVLKEVFAALSKQLRTDPNTIVIYDMVTSSYNYDPIQ